MKTIIQGKTFEDILYQYSDMITRLCTIHLRNSDDGKDCFQDVFIKLFQSRKKFESEEHLKAWLIRVCINSCKDYQRKYYKHIDDIDNVILQSEDQHDQLLPVLLDMEPPYKNALYLYYYEGYSVLEISEILKMNVNTIKSHLRRGRQILKEKLGDDYE